MDHRHSQPEAGTDFVREAESLIRSLAGVVHARIQATPDGIDAIHVTATDDDAAISMAAHVRSALLAGLATPVVPARIHVRAARAATAARAIGPDAAAAEPSDAAPFRIGDPAAPRDRLRLLHDDPSRTGEDADNTLDKRAGEGAGEEGAGGGADGQEDDPGLARRARLVAVDVRRPGDGRIVCRVSVAWEAHVHRAEAVAMDLPGAAAQAAAQAAVRALVSAGFAGLELNGLREVEIAGREYVLVALRRQEGPVVRHRSGSAHMFGTSERSAAEAAVDAANELL